MNTGRLVKEVRESAGMSQKALAEKVGISTTWMSQIEKGRKSPTVNLIQKICMACDVSPHLAFWFSADIDDVAKDKQQQFLLMKPSIDAMIKSIWKNS